MRTHRICAIAALLTALVPSAAAAGPALASRWLETKMTQDACLQRAEAALRKSGFKTVEPTRESRYGVDPDYTGAVRCIAGNRMIIFMATGPDRMKTDELAGALFQNFDPARP